jgi:hypothetical protein
LVFANEYNAIKQEKNVINYIKENFTEVSNAPTNDWILFIKTNPELVNKIIISMAGSELLLKTLFKNFCQRNSGL